MTEFNKLCKQVEELDVLSYATILAEKSAKIIPALSALSGNGLDGVSIFADFILGSIVADGKLAEEEYLLMYPLLKDFFGEGINYEDCKKVVKSIRPESKEFKNALNDLVDYLGTLSEDLKDDIIIVCLLICSVDGKISLKEKQWIKQLIK
jgi:uncharacterized tellurite resistance protein B-like protein